MYLPPATRYIRLSKGITVMSDAVRILNHAEILLARSRKGYLRSAKAHPDRVRDRARLELMSPIDRACYLEAQKVMLGLRDRIRIEPSR